MSRVLYRIASLLLVVFAAGHTAGFLTFRPPTAAGIAVREAMKNVTFTVGHSTFSYAGFYVGFGLFVTTYLLFAAFLAWQLGSLSISARSAIHSVAWTFFALQSATLVLSWMYFSAIPVAFSAVLAACTGTAAWSLGERATVVAARP